MSFSPCIKIRTSIRFLKLNRTPVVPGGKKKSPIVRLLQFEGGLHSDITTGLYVDLQGSGPVLWTSTGRKALPPFTSLPVMYEIAGVNTALVGGYLHSTKTRARWAEGFHELNGHVFNLERDGLRQVVLCPRLTMR